MFVHEAANLVWLVGSPVDIWVIFKPPAPDEVGILRSFSRSLISSLFTSPGWPRLEIWAGFVAICVTVYNTFFFHWYEMDTPCHVKIGSLNRCWLNSFIWDTGPLNAAVPLRAQTSYTLHFWPCNSTFWKFTKTSPKYARTFYLTGFEKICIFRTINHSGISSHSSHIECPLAAVNLKITNM